MKAQQLLALFILLSAASAWAATDTWTGGAGSANTNWSTPGNWVSNTAPAASGDTLVFDGTTGLSANNNVANTYSGLTFSATSGAFILTGNGVKMNGTITDNNATLTETFNFSTAAQFTSSGKSISVTSGGVLDFQSAIQGANGFSKTGLGTLIMRGSNSGYTGAIAVNAGTLLADSLTSSTGAGALSVASGATVGGTGFITAVTTTISSGGTLLAGDGSGGTGTILTMNSALTMNAGSTLSFDLGAGNAHSVLALGSTATFNNGIINFVNITDGVFTGLITGLTADPSASWALSSAELGQGYVATFHYNSDGTLDATITGGLAVPEPSTWAMMIGGVAVLVLAQRRRFTLI